MRINSRWGWLGCFVAVGLSLFACDPAVDDDEARSAGVYVGAVDGSDMMVGVAVDGDKLRIYTCGGADSLASSKWFKGTVTELSDFDLHNGAWSIRGAWVDGRLEGELHTPEGEAHAWSADPAEPGTSDGLYAATTGQCTSGVVIRHDGQGGPAQAQGTWCDGQGNLAQIIVLSPFAMTRRGILVEAQPVREAPVSRFYVTPVAP